MAAVRRLGSLLIVVAIAGGATALALAAQTPKALRASILAAARAQRSVHYVTNTHGVATLRIDGDVAGDRGVQRIAFTKAGRTGHVTVRVVKRIAYVRGDAFSMRNYMLFSASQSSRYAGRWISVPQSWSSYSTLAAAVTLRSFLSELNLKGTSARISGTVGGRRVVGVRTTGKEHGLRAIDTLWARAGAKPLPVQDKLVAPSKGYLARATMTRWNERVAVRAPAHAVPISIVARG